MYPNGSFTNPLYHLFIYKQSHMLSTLHMQSLVHQAPPLQARVFVRRGHRDGVQPLCVVASARVGACGVLAVGCFCKALIPCARTFPIIPRGRLFPVAPQRRLPSVRRGAARSTPARELGRLHTHAVLSGCAEAARVVRGTVRHRKRPIRTQRCSLAAVQYCIGSFMFSVCAPSSPFPLARESRCCFSSSSWGRVRTLRGGLLGGLEYGGDLRLRRTRRSSLGSCVYRCRRGLCRDVCRYLCCYLGWDTRLRGSEGARWGGCCVLCVGGVRGGRRWWGVWYAVCATRTRVCAGRHCV